MCAEFHMFSLQYVFVGVLLVPPTVQQHAVIWTYTYLNVCVCVWSPAMD